MGGFINHLHKMTETGVFWQAVWPVANNFAFHV
jgi:hypothetical protein